MARLYPTTLVSAMLRLILTALAALFALPAFAQTSVTPPPGLEDMAPPPPGAVSVAKDGRMVMSSTLCPSLAGAEAGVPGADYTPGVDADGNPVAPADLPSATPPLKLDDFPIEISVNLQKRFGIPANSSLFHGKAVVGYVTVQDGRAYFNGQPISQNEQDMLAAACQAAKPR
jgi:hypothetical protein